jgi:hypothetical protein
MAEDTCGMCGAKQPLLERYPSRACSDCEKQATCEAHDRRVVGHNTSPAPPWFWVQHTDDESRCDEASRGGLVWVQNIRCRVVEGRFGGTFVMRAD